MSALKSHNFLFNLRIREFIVIIGKLIRVAASILAEDSGELGSILSSATEIGSSSGNASASAAPFPKEDEDDEDEDDEEMILVRIFNSVFD